MDYMDSIPSNQVLDHFSTDHYTLQTIQTTTQTLHILSIGVCVHIVRS